MQIHLTHTGFKWSITFSLGFHSSSAWAYYSFTLFHIKSALVQMCWCLPQTGRLRVNTGIQIWLREQRPVEEIKTLWSIGLTSVLRFCWPRISCLICESLTGISVMDTLLKGCYDLKRLKWCTLLHNTDQTDDRLKRQLLSSCDCAMKRSKQKADWRIPPECQCTLLLSNLLIKRFRPTTVHLNLNPNTLGMF